MVFIRCPDKVVISYRDLRPKSPEFSTYSIRVVLGGFAGQFSRLCDLVAMLVSTG